MSLTPDDVLKAARLARLALSEQDVAEVVPRLNRVLALFEVMRAVDTEGVEPMAHALEGRPDSAAEIRQRLRADEVSESDRRAEFQAGAPAVDEGLYLVPRVVE